MLSLAKLKSRANKALFNISEVEDEFLNKAIEDANEATLGKEVKSYIVEDFAYIRLKIYLKIELSEEDEILYKEALKQIEKSPLIDELGVKTSPYFYGVKNKEEFL